MYGVIVGTVVSVWATNKTSSYPNPYHRYASEFRCFSIFCLTLLQFAGPNEMTMGSDIAAGPSNSVVIDKQGMYWMAGKVGRLPLISSSDALANATQWKNTGDGSSGQPYSSFRYMHDIMCVDHPLGHLLATDLWAI